jgi:hypothetical protein
MGERRPQLLVHLVFHPDSESARELARQVHLALNADPNVPGLRIPTVFCAEDGSGAPPADQQLDRALRSFVAPLADADVDADDAWCGFVAGLWQSCQTSRHRCVPFQLSDYAWPLDDRLREVNFVRAFAVAEQQRAAFVIRRLITELCRFLHGDPLQDESPAAPTKVFISHTKLDLVAAHNRLEGVDPVARIENVIGWPLPFGNDLKSRYKHAATLMRVGRPEGIDETLDPLLVANPPSDFPPKSAELRYAWARGMTAMRKAVTETTRARIVIGGTFGPTEKRQRMVELVI